MLFFRIPVFNPDKLLMPGAVTALTCFVSKKFVITMHITPVEAFCLPDSQADTLAAMFAGGTCHLWLYLLKQIIICDKQFLDRAVLKIQASRESSHPAQPAAAAQMLDELRRVDEYLISLSSFDRMMRGIAKKPPSGFRNTSSGRLLRRLVFCSAELVYTAQHLEHDVHRLANTSRQQAADSRMDTIRDCLMILAAVMVLCVPAITTALLCMARLPVWVKATATGVVFIVTCMAIYLLIKLIRTSLQQRRLPLINSIHHTGEYIRV